MREIIEKKRGSKRWSKEEVEVRGSDLKKRIEIKREEERDNRGIK